MSNTTMTKEYKIAHDVFGLTIEDLEKLTINAMKSAFVPYKRRIELIYDKIKPGYKKPNALYSKKKKSS
jgi:adenosine deaminase